jgi:hypothetical protein
MVSCAYCCSSLVVGSGPAQSPGPIPLILAGLAVGLGFGALAEVAKKSLRPENSTGELHPTWEAGACRGSC